MPTIWMILDWISYGLIRYVLSLVPLVRAPRVDRGPPASWWRYAGYWEWAQATADNGYPTESWARSWLGMAFGELQRVATDAARPYVEEARSYLRGLIGTIKSGFGSLGSWTNWLQVAIGAAVPWWTSDLSGGLNHLRGLLPDAIRNAWRSWDGIWENIKSEVRTWAHNQFDSAVGWARSARDWVSGVGDSLRRWRDTVSGWIDAFRANPYAFIAGVLGGAWSWLLGFYSHARETVIGWLGPDWVKLTTFARDCSVFYYNLWSLGWRTLSDFIADPVGFVGDRLEAYLLKKW